MPIVLIKMNPLCLSQVTPRPLIFTKSLNFMPIVLIIVDSFCLPQAVPRPLVFTKSLIYILNE